MLEDSGRHLKYVVPVQNNLLYYRAGTRYIAAWAARLVSPCDTLNLRCTGTVTGRVRLYKMEMNPR